jgi:hypothetical protein
MEGQHMGYEFLKPPVSQRVNRRILLAPNHSGDDLSFLFLLGERR